MPQMDAVRAHLSSVRVPSHHDKVYKEECMFSFDTPESPAGLHVSLTSFQGFGVDYLPLHYRRTNEALYLHEKWVRVPLPDLDPETAAAVAAATGTMQVTLGAPRHTFDKAQSLVVWGPEGLVLELALPCPELPELVLQSINAISAHESASVAEAAAVWQEERRVSRYAADLVQLDPGARRISPNPRDWRCDETGVTENLWLNLSTGHIGSGRQNWDGSGGNGSALRHFESTGRKYPLVVKLGTITPHGADVYSYAPDEDDMVLDPSLAQHLAHWGINMMQMEKTEASMAELQMALNTSYEFSRITEAGGKSLVPVSGPGFTGLINLGNSCYMNSVMQVLWTLPEVSARYVDQADALFGSAPHDPANDVPSQLAKLGVALQRGRTGAPAAVAMDCDAEAPAARQGDAAAGGADAAVALHAVRPGRIKALLGRGHPEFSTGRQQDALEYFEFLLEQISRAEHGSSARLGIIGSAPAAGPPNASALPTRALFGFQLEERLQCTETQAVRYKQREEVWLGLDIPLGAAINQEAVEASKERAAKRAQMKAESAVAYIPASAEPGDAAITAGPDAAQAGVTPAVRAVLAAGAEDDDKVIPQVPFAACLERWAGEEVVDDVYSAAAGHKTAATRRTRFASFPPYLMLAMKRYYTGDNWVPKKMEVCVEVPQVLDLTALRAAGPQPEEMLQPEEGTAGPPSGAAQGAPAPGSAAPEPQPELVASLVSMGFSENGCKRAALATGNASVEAAMEWLLGHLEDADLNDPLPPASAPDAPTAAPAADFPAESVSMLTGMGFTDLQAKGALKACSGALDRAADWLFSHMDDLDTAVAQALAVPVTTTAAAGVPARPVGAVLDGSGKYELLGIVSHMGSNTSCGHYVAHVRKNGRWYIFNDEKVAESEAPPLDLGYCYLFQRSS